MSVTGRTWLDASEAAAYEASKAAMAELLRERDEARAVLRALVDVCCEPGLECRVCHKRECRPPCRALAAKKILERSRA
jgi:hypothetical protein